MDKSRLQFEEEFKDCNSLDVDDPFRIWDEINDYYYLETRQAWFWWQASRESLINSLEPVGYMESNGIDYINKHGFTHINAEQSGSINIPLYRLD
ncbi:hypothetical protein [Providencia rettgeri]|uniref:hypothetical protein n=1 Tax=Providencia rettgeri TaxID=587 RepID=UPI003525E1D6